jgi:hypothetical protein
MVFSHGKVEMYTRVTTLMTREKAMVRCFGPMAQSIKANGNKECNMVMVR